MRLDRRRNLDRRHRKPDRRSRPVALNLVSVGGTTACALGRFFPLPLAAPLLKRGFVFLARHGRCVKEEFGDAAAGQRSGGRFSRQSCNPSQVFKEVAGSRLRNTAAVVPGCEFAEYLRKPRKGRWADGCGGRMCRAVKFEKLSSFADQVQAFHPATS